MSTASEISISNKLKSRNPGYFGWSTTGEETFFLSDLSDLLPLPAYYINLLII